MTRWSSGVASSVARPTVRETDEAELRPRSPSALLHDVDGRRRRQGRHHLRSHRRLRLQHRRRRGQHVAFRSQPKTTGRPGTMHIHDLNATILHLLGIDHRRLTYRYQGRDFRLTDIHGHVIDDIVA